MIVLRCSRCDREIEVGEPRARQTVLCPYCGQLLAKGSGIQSENRDEGGGETMLPPEQESAIDTDTDEFSFLKPGQDAKELGRLGHYKVLKLLGKGGMAIVFMAEDTILQRPVALKVMRPDL